MLSPFFFFWRKEGVLTTAYVSGYFDLFEVKKKTLTFLSFYDKRISELCVLKELPAQ